MTLKAPAPYRRCRRQHHTVPFGHILMAPLLFVFLMVGCILPQTHIVQAQSADATAEVKLSLHEFQELYSSASIKDAERRLLDQQKMQKAEHERTMAELRHSSEAATAKQQEQHRRELLDMFPTNFQVLQHKATGVYNRSSPQAGVEGDVAVFDLELTLRVMDTSFGSASTSNADGHSHLNNWTIVPLVNTSSTVAANWNVALQQPQNVKKNDDDDDDSLFQPIDPVLDPRVVLMQRGEQLVLATNQSGLFQLSYQAYTRVGKQARNLQSVGLSNLLYPLTSSLEFSIAKTTPSTTSRDFSVQPPSSVLHVLPNENITQVKVTLPLTADSFQIRWVDVQELAQEEDTTPPATASSEGRTGSGGAKKPASPPRSSKPVVTESPTGPPQVTVSTESLHSVAEGVLRSVHTLAFETMSELTPLNSIQFVVKGGNRVRVTSVSGHALQSWNSQELRHDESHGSNSTNTTTASSSSSSPEAETQQLVTATFKTSQLSSTIILKVHTESDRGEAKEATVSLPRIQCWNVLRQTGSIAVIKDANVEVHESKIMGVSRVEPSDLPSQLRLNVDRPIVLSYKFLNPNYDVGLSITEHTALDTLEATIDRIHYQAVVTEDAHVVHSMILILQSMKLQYLEVMNLPESSSKFSVLVNSESAKPVRSDSNSGHGSNADGTTSILVPLMVAGLNPETANKGGSLQTSVELTFFSTHDEALGENGTIAMNLPQFDLPVSVFSTRLSLPSNYAYNFTGSFGAKSHEKSSIYPIPEAFRYVKGKRVVREDHEFTILDDMYPEDREEQGKSGAVRIVTPKSGRNYYFQKLLVLDGGLELNVTYGPHPKPKQEQPKTVWNRIVGLFHQKE